MSHPLIPKALAAKIIRAQEAVKDKRRTIAYKEREQDRLKDEEAALYVKLLSGDLDDHVYGLKMDSIRRKQDRENERRPQRYTELDGLEVELAALEVVVLRKVSTMRPTEGRVKWPRQLQPFATPKN